MNNPIANEIRKANRAGSITRTLDGHEFKGLYGSARNQVQQLRRMAQRSLKSGYLTRAQAACNLMIKLNKDFDLGYPIGSIERIGTITGGLK